jgi:hypothetical protein
MQVLEQELHKGKGKYQPKKKLYSASPRVFHFILISAQFILLVDLKEALPIPT